MKIVLSRQRVLSRKCSTNELLNGPSHTLELCVAVQLVLLGTAEVVPLSPANLAAQVVKKAALGLKHSSGAVIFLILTTRGSM